MTDAVEAAKRIVAFHNKWNPAEIRDDAIVARALLEMANALDSVQAHYEAFPGCWRGGYDCQCGRFERND